MINKLRISHTGNHDLIVQSNGVGTFRVQPMSWWEKLTRQYVEIPIGDNQLVVIRTEIAKEPDGVSLTNIV